jgi:hypothetical protein
VTPPAVRKSLEVKLLLLKFENLGTTKKSQAKKFKIAPGFKRNETGSAGVPLGQSKSATKLLLLA